MQLDKRWLKAKIPDFFEEFVVSKPCHLPLNNRHNIYSNYIIYSSTKEAVSPTQLSNEGVYFQFDLPNTALPTFSGLSGLISYVVLITIQINNKTSYVTYPFRVLGHGGYAIIPTM
jgi:hypothetical protein